MPDAALLIPIGISVGSLLLLSLAMIAVYRRAYVAVEQGFALLVTGQGAVRVSFTGRLVTPILNRGELLDLRAVPIVVDRRGAQGLSCHDHLRADIEATFHVRIRKTPDDMIKAAQAVGASKVADPATLEQRFLAKFSDALATVAKQLDFEQLVERRVDFGEQVLSVIGDDLDGWELDDLAIGHLAQTPIEHLDPNDLLDAQGIRRITEATAAERVRTAEIERDAEQRVRTLEAEAVQAALELERAEADTFAAFRTATGRDVTREQLESRLLDKVRALMAEAEAPGS